MTDYTCKEGEQEQGCGNLRSKAFRKHFRTLLMAIIRRRSLENCTKNSIFEELHNTKMSNSRKTEIKYSIRTCYITSCKQKCVLITYVNFKWKIRSGM